MEENQNLKNNPGKVDAHRHFKRLGREFAMQYLYMYEVSKAASPEEEAKDRENFWEQAEESGTAADGRIFSKARLYAEKLIVGVMEHREEIDKTIASFSERWDISRMPKVDINIIRIGIYELQFCPDIPVLVCINEAIEIAKDYAAERSGNFINGILNGVKDALPPGRKAEK